jgi:peptide-methionine (S)-S-oxide reductase
MQNSEKQETEIATLAGGCFWCLEGVFSSLIGVEKVESGYSGGFSANPSYEQVSTGATGHAETVQITFDPDIVSFEELLKIFFAFHDPTTLNRQGADTGTQYRSAIFYHNAEQKQVAEKTISELEAAKIWNQPIVTEVKPFEAFYPAEQYHQHYYEQNPDQPYCRAVIAPKLAKLRREYAGKLRS